MNANPRECDAKPHCGLIPSLAGSTDTARWHHVSTPINSLVVGLGRYVLIKCLLLGPRHLPVCDDVRRLHDTPPEHLRVLELCCVYMRVRARGVFQPHACRTGTRDRGRRDEQEERRSGAYLRGLRRHEPEDEPLVARKKAQRLEAARVFRVVLQLRVFGSQCVRPPEREEGNEGRHARRNSRRRALSGSCAQYGRTAPE